MLISFPARLVSFIQSIEYFSISTDLISSSKVACTTEEGRGRGNIEVSRKAMRVLPGDN